MSAAVRRSTFLVILFGTALAGCAPLAPPAASPGSAAGAGGIAVRERRSGRFVELIGVKTQHAPPFLGTPGTNFYCLRSILDRKTGESVDQLYVADSYDGKERNWDAALDADGHALRFIPISRVEIVCDGGGCSYAEEFAADIPEREFWPNPHDIAVTFTDPAGDRKTIRVSAGQIAAQLAAVAAQQKTSPVPAASADAPPAAHQP